jgi:hypothetical protein
MGFRSTKSDLMIKALLPFQGFSLIFLKFTKWNTKQKDPPSSFVIKDEKPGNGNNALIIKSLFVDRKPISRKKSQVTE